MIMLQQNPEHMSAAGHVTDGALLISCQCRFFSIQLTHNGLFALSFPRVCSIGMCVLMEEEKRRDKYVECGFLEGCHYIHSETEQNRFTSIPDMM